MKTSDVMHLIDLLADLDTPAAGELRTCADRALAQADSHQLRIGVVTEGGRPITEILDLVDDLGARRDVWSVSSKERPTGVDAWVLVVEGGQAGFERERRFLSRVGTAEKAVVATGFEQLSSEVAVARRDEIVRSFSELGLGTGRFCFGTADLTVLRRTLEGWKERREALRAAALAALVEPLEAAVASDQTAVDEALHRLPDEGDAKRALEGFRGRWSGATEAFNTAAGEVASEMREEVAQRWSEWAKTVTANHGEEVNRERVQESLERWLADRFVSRYAERLEQRLTTHAEHLPQLKGAVAGIGAAQTADFSAPAVELSATSPSRLRWLLPLAGGGAGWWRGGPRLALVGAALGFVIARLLRTSLGGNPLEDRRLIDAAADHLVTHLEILTQRAVQGLDTECALEVERLERAVAEAERVRPQRDGMINTLEQLAKVRSLLGSASQAKR